jgi:cation/acetate symporter
MVATYEPFGLGARLWWDIKPNAAGIFGVPLGLLALVVGSLLTAPPNEDEHNLSVGIRFPGA